MKVAITADELQIDLVDGRRLAVPLAWFPRLVRATVKQRAKFEFIGEGEGIHWPAVDEDLSVEGLLDGSRPPAGSENFRSPLLDRHGRARRPMRRRRSTGS